VDQASSARIVATNGDVANKAGTYPLAIAARRHPRRSTSRRDDTLPDPACAATSLIEQRSARNCGMCSERKLPANARLQP
jgi:methylthioribose-1-phosphate isomerase